MNLFLKYQNGELYDIHIILVFIRAEFLYLNINGVEMYYFRLKSTLSFESY